MTGSYSPSKIHGDRPHETLENIASSGVPIFFHGVATPKTHPELWKRLTDEFGPERKARGLYKEVWPPNAFLGNLLRLILLERYGRNEQLSREIRGYYLKMAETTGTLWEFDRPEASCNHGFASYLAILLNVANK